jgi:hypothetical protein
LVLDSPASCARLQSEAARFEGAIDLQWLVRKDSALLHR